MNNNSQFDRYRCLYSPWIKGLEHWKGYCGHPNPVFSTLV